MDDLLTALRFVNEGLQQLVDARIFPVKIKLEAYEKRIDAYESRIEALEERLTIFEGNETLPDGLENRLREIAEEVSVDTLENACFEVTVRS